MTRMSALIEDGAARGVRVMNLSLVTTDRRRWLRFEDAARGIRRWCSWSPPATMAATWRGIRPILRASIWPI